MDFQTLNLLFKCNKEFNHEKLQTKDINDTECMICSYIFSNPECSQDDVASALRTDKTTVAKALSILEDRKYISRSQDTEDKRKKRLCITETGREKMSDIMNIHDEWLSQVLTCLSDNEQKQFENYCKRLLSAAEQLSEKQKNGGQ